MNRYTVTLVLFVTGSCACTSLGPMPAITLSDPVPSRRGRAEIQGAFVPGFYLSNVVANQNATVIPQIAGAFNLGPWVKVDGLSVGGRVVDGGDSSPLIEPLLKYRRFLDSGKRFSMAFSGFGTFVKGEADGASYSAFRGGIELGSDLRITPKYKWIELHIQGGIAATGISASGEFCMADDGLAVTCETSQTANSKAQLDGVFPTAFAGSVLDLFNGFPSLFHGIKIGAYYSAGLMPTLRFNQRQDDRFWRMFGGQISINFGASTE